MDGASEPADMVNKSVIKAVRLVRELAAQPTRTGLTATELARAVGMSRPTVARLALSLERSGVLDRVGNTYVLGWELARLGRRADPYAGMVAKAQPLLQELADYFNESVSLSVPNPHDELDLVAEAAGSHYVNIASRLASMVGQQYPLHASSSGKVLLAEMPVEKVVSMMPERLEAFTAETITDRTMLLRELDKVRDQGFAVVDNELEQELISLSRPVRDPAGALVAILTLNGPRYRFGRSRMPEALNKMQEIVGRLADLFWQEHG